MRLTKTEVTRHGTETQEIIIYNITDDGGNIVGVADEWASIEHPTATTVTYRTETGDNTEYYAVPMSERSAKGAELSAEGAGLSLVDDDISKLFDRGYGVYALK